MTRPDMPKVVSVAVLDIDDAVAKQALSAASEAVEAVVKRPVYRAWFHEPRQDARGETWLVLYELVNAWDSGPRGGGGFRFLDALDKARLHLGLTNDPT